MRSLYVIALLALLPLHSFAAGTTEFCLEGEFNLGVQLQGYDLIDEHWVPMTWCVVTEDDSNRVFFSSIGKSNPDMDGDWTVAYLPPDLVRIVNRESPPDVEFHGTDNLSEALAIRRLDPKRFMEELQAHPDRIEPYVQPDWFEEMPESVRNVVPRNQELNLPGQEFESLIELESGRIKSFIAYAILPMWGETSLKWRWDWSDPVRPKALISSEKGWVVWFDATGRWRDVPDDEAAALWEATAGADPIEVPGDRWPARINMQLINLTDNVYLVRGVRTGFQHMVIDGKDGLIVADAPTGWVEFHHVPPANLVPGLGVDGLSNKLIEFLSQEFEGRPISAVALTHFHGDHAGGARAFAAVGAHVYAPPEIAEVFGEHLDLVGVAPVVNTTDIGDEGNQVRLISIGANPHVSEMLGVWAVDRGYFFVSDIHVPRDDGDAPSAHRAQTECWFAGWAVKNLPPDVNVVNSHSPNITPVSRLAKYLESEVCRGLGPARTGD